MAKLDNVRNRNANEMRDAFGKLRSLQWKSRASIGILLCLLIDPGWAQMSLMWKLTTSTSSACSSDGIRGLFWKPNLFSRELCLGFSSEPLFPETIAEQLVLQWWRPAENDLTGTVRPPDERFLSEAPVRENTATADTHADILSLM
jgi:hypothetical protein